MSLQCRRPGFDLWVGKIPGEVNSYLLQYSCLENSMDTGAWQSTVHRVTERWTRLSDFPFTFHFHALEKEMATYSSVLAWRIPGTPEYFGHLMRRADSLEKTLMLGGIEGGRRGRQRIRWLDARAAELQLCAQAR